MRARNFGKFAITLFLCGLTSVAWGFNKNVHREISEKAVQLYRYLYPQDTVLTDELAKRFIEGSVEEDAITLNVQRLFNWHFYDPGKRLGRTWWGAYRSNTHRFNNLAKDFVTLNSSNVQECYKLAGRLVHHIQDMSSPPHTVPVYHTTKDQFDKLVPGEIARISFSSNQLDNVLQRKGALTITGLNKLLTNAAERTIASINSQVMENGRIVADNWTNFWRKYELVGEKCGEIPKPEFGCYGKMTYWDQKDGFSKSVFEQYHNERIISAISDSLQILILLRENHN
ncbi:hypothetical protein JWJ90_05775 [Desulfobulbus rhabdoformis]|uniref:hypothetical protein n=1 Tax=Desulfobulbus rhabdoformis TaxID=34032 RepID=UPI001965CDC0|nr:hypothetical protein [Desulfobulbus rhabdoformis]MBM9613795.1 hypothetical protein [Desulfobulbus rhabdoformis]